MQETVKSVADASKEIASTATEAIKATEKLGGFIAPLIKEPLENVIGLLTDKLKYVRWERQLRFAIKTKERIDKLKKEHNINAVPPKIALPIIENASVEEDDYMQDIWIRLLTSAATTINKVRPSYIEIIKQLDPLDAKILYNVYNLIIDKWNKTENKINYTHQFERPLFLFAHIYELEVIKNIENTEVEHSLDNLFRLRCLRSAILEEDVTIDGNNEEEIGTVSIPKDQEYYSVQITRLGFNLVNLCKED